MTTVKEILAANRDSVISSIKFSFKVYDYESVKVKMVEFIAFCEQFMNVEKFENSKRVKTDLSDLVKKMKISQKELTTDNRKWYEIADSAAANKGLYWNSRTGEMEKI